jgi:predicted nucleic acid-binding protein
MKRDEDEKGNQAFISCKVCCGRNILDSKGVMSPMPYRVQLLTDRKPNPKSFIHRGEAEVIIQASELQIRGHNVSEILMDERMGTNIARQSFRFEVRATGGVLALLKQGHIIKESVEMLLKKCRDEIDFNITDKVIYQVLEEYGVE